VRLESATDKSASHVEIVADSKQSRKLRGATILVDGEEKGSLPGVVEVDDGPHQIEVEMDGFESFETWVELGSGDSKRVVVKMESLSGVDDEDEPAEDDEGLDDLNQSSSSPNANQLPFVLVGAGIELAGRVFAWKNRLSTDLRNFDAMLPALRLDVQVFPGSRSKSPFAQGLALTFSWSKGAPVTSTTSDGIGVKTSWGDADVGIRYVAPINVDYALGGSAAWGREQFEFDRASMLSGEVPGVDYRYLRVGADFDMHISPSWQAFGGADYYKVIAIGALANNFDNTNASAFGLRVGGVMHINRSFSLKLHATYSRFRLKTLAKPGDMFLASGATDQFFSALIAAVYER